MNDTIVIYTDGACRGNPGNGGFGVVMMQGNYRKEFMQGFTHTTNNRMELMSIVFALRQIKKPLQRVEIYSDSKYVVDAIEKKWLNNWIKIQFKNKKNKDLWLQYYELSKLHHIKLNWVKGHASNPFNNRCDELAVAASLGSNLQNDIGYNPREEDLF
jgi:ribonuclease HI